MKPLLALMAYRRRELILGFAGLAILLAGSLTAIAVLHRPPPPALTSRASQASAAAPSPSAAISPSAVAASPSPAALASPTPAPSAAPPPAPAPALAPSPAAPPGHPAAGQPGAVGWDAADHELVMWAIQGKNADTYVWRGSGPWQPVAGAGGPASPLPAMMAFDGAIGHLIMLDTPTYAPSDLWSWDGHRWTYVTSLADEVTQSASMAYLPEAHKVFLVDNNLSPTPTYAFDGSHFVLLHPAHTPSDLGTRLGYDPNTHTLDLVSAPGGGSAGGLWRFDGSDWSLAVASTGGPDWSGSGAIELDPVTGTWVSFGGYTGNGDSSETEVFDGTVWKKVAPATVPPPRWTNGPAISAYDPDLGIIVMYGGMNVGAPPLQDTWGWNGATWSLLES